MQTENKNLFLIHGAWSTRKSFNYLVKKTLDDYNIGKIHCFEYDCQKEPIQNILLRAKSELIQTQSNGLRTIVLGHSLGGLFALKLSRKKGIYKTITVASPLSGLRLPGLVQYFVSFHTPIMKHIHPGSKFMRSIHDKDYSACIIDIIVAANGYNPMIYEKNDGVITISSQTEWIPRNASVTFSDNNHHEILQSAELIRAVEKALTS